MSAVSDAAAFRRALLAWHALHARDLPWRGETDPYRVWVSEIMLQQTTTQTVKGYYARFLEAFPTVQVLAAASEEEVFRLWQGLGYYSRARSLLKTARIIAYERGGRFPEDEEGLRALPGIGEYTAGAVASMAFGQAALAMDGNVTRALSRLTAERGDVGAAAVRKRLRAAGLTLIDPDTPGEFNQALMGLGRLVCVPANPRCDTCPVAAFCEARAAGCQRELPRRAERAKQRIVRRGVALVLCGGRVLARKRPEKGLLAGLWEFPGFDGALDGPSVAEALAELGLTGLRGGGEIASVDHTFTHIIWRMKGYPFSAEGVPLPGRGGEARLVTARELKDLPMPTAMSAFRALAEDILNKETHKDK